MIGAARFECPHESDVLTAVYTRRWPDRADETLRAHVATCEICRDLAAEFGGDLQAHNHPEGGACFVLTVPVGPASDTAKDIPSR